MDNLRLFILGFKSMRKLVIKALILTIGVYAVVIGINYVVDPANLFRKSLLDQMISALSKGKIIESPGNYDEGMLLKGVINALDQEPKTLILGSSHTMYLPWDENYEGVLVGGLSNAYLGDYYAVLGMMESRGYMPERVIVGIDSWTFYKDSLSGRINIVDYAKYEKNKIEGKETFLTQESNGHKFEKIKELASFPYFQSSFIKLQADGFHPYLCRQTQQVVIAEDDSTSEKTKLMPDCRIVMSYSQYQTIDEIEAMAQSAIDEGVIGNLSNGYTDLQKSNLDEFEEMVFYLQKNGVEVEFYLPAWYPSLYEFFENNEDFEGVIKLEQYLRQLGKKYSIVVHGSYDPKLSDIVPEDFADWAHLKADRMLDNYNTIVEIE